MCEEFYMVVADVRRDNIGIVPGEVMTSPPKFIHTTEKSAEAEAVRLAKESAGVEYIVLKSVASVVIDDDKPKWAEAV